jgi:predicted enzyme related to lactoylglutathione lyase
VANFNLVVLYVKDSAASAAFYETLLDRKIAQSSPKFSMLPLSGGAMLGLWQREAVEPSVGNELGGSEIAFNVADADAVRATHETWKARGAKIAQGPTALPFGHSFVALDPDGHRLRVLAPPAQ